MTKSILAFILGTFGSMAALPSDYQWIERGWISDAELSLKANPEVESLDPAEIATFASMFGKTVWEFKGGLFTGIQLTNGARGTSPYSLRPIDDAQFEIIYYTQGHQERLRIWPVDGGFCAKHEPAWIDDYKTWTDPTIVECYVPYDS